MLRYARGSCAYPPGPAESLAAVRVLSESVIYPGATLGRGFDEMSVAEEGQGDTPNHSAFLCIPSSIKAQLRKTNITNRLT